MPSPSPSPQVVDSRKRSRYQLLVGDEVAGKLTYTDRDDVRVLVHTVIRDEFEGQGLASVLVRAVLDDARATGRRIVPECSFVRGYLARHDEYADVVADPPPAAAMG